MIEKDLIRSVNDATLLLCCGDEPLKERLLSAIRALNVTLNQRQDWPVMLRRRAQDILDELNSAVTPEAAITAMDSQSARRLAERILHLYADCQAAVARKKS